MAKLTEAQLGAAMKTVTGWKRDGEYITKEFKFKEFMDGIDFVRKVAKIAEKEGHHPDIHVVWTTVTLKITTHDQGGLTKWDFALAKKINKRLSKKKASK